VAADIIVFLLISRFSEEIACATHFLTFVLAWGQKDFSKKKIRDSSKLWSSSHRSDNPKVFRQNKLSIFYLNFETPRFKN
jgi:hypothetical protein